MREQITVGGVVIPVREVVRARAILARLVMLHAVAGQVIGEREEKIVVLVMVRAEQTQRLRDEIAMHLELMRRNLEVLRGIGDDVHVYGGLGAGGEIDTLEVFAGVNR